MLTSTEAARAQLANDLADRERPDDTAARLICSDFGNALILDKRTKGDT